jgi:hypothetical protein
MIGKQFFLAALIMMSLFAVGHFGGFLQAAYAARHDPRLADLTKAMQQYKTNFLGFQPSMLDFREYFSLNFSVLLSLGAGLGFTTLAVVPDQPSVIRALSPIYVGAFSLLLGASAYFSVFQGIVACTLIVLLFGLAWWFA